jgi:5-methyltetrahydrofolate--homocysteine methyltransferase
MIVIAERINGTRKHVQQAILGRDADHIRQEASAQAEAGAHYIDVNAGTQPAREPEDLVWLVKTVQGVVDLPCAVDTPNPAAMAAALEVHRGQALVNSITGEKARLEGILPLVVKHKARVIALALDDSGMPSTCEQRCAVAAAIVRQVAGKGVPLTDLFIDPLVRPLSSEPEQVAAVLAATAAIKAAHPGVNISYGLSNISFGLPNRHLLNRTFLAMAIAQGLDAALIDPLDRHLMAVLRAARALLAQDEYCAGYIAAHREGRLSP